MSTFRRIEYQRWKKLLSASSSPSPCFGSLLGFRVGKTTPVPTQDPEFPLTP